MIDLNKYAVVETPISEIDLNDDTFQCRVAVDEKSDDELAEDLKKNGQQYFVILIDFGNRKVRVDGHRRIKGLIKAGIPTVKAKVIPVADLKDWLKEGVEIAIFCNRHRGNYVDEDYMEGAFKLRKAGTTLSEIGRILDKDRKYVRYYLLIYAAGQEIQDAVKKKVLPIMKTAIFLDKGSSTTDNKAGGETMSHPPSEGDDNFQIDTEKASKLIEALKSHEPKKSGKAVLAGQEQAPNQEGSGQAGEVAGKQSGAEAGFKPPKAVNGRIKLTGDFPEDILLKDFLKAAKEFHQKLQESRKQANKKAEKQSFYAKVAEDKPTAAELEEAVNKKQEQADNNQTEIDTLEHTVADFTTKGKDTKDLQEHLEGLKAEQKKLKAELSKLKRQLKPAKTGKTKEASASALIAQLEAGIADVNKRIDDPNTSEIEKAVLKINLTALQQKLEEMKKQDAASNSSPQRGEDKGDGGLQQSTPVETEDKSTPAQPDASAANNLTHSLYQDQLKQARDKIAREKQECSTPEGKAKYDQIAKALDLKDSAEYLAKQEQNIKALEDMIKGMESGS